MGWASPSAGLWLESGEARLGWPWCSHSRQRGAVRKRDALGDDALSRWDPPLICWAPLPRDAVRYCTRIISYQLSPWQVQDHSRSCPSPAKGKAPQSDLGDRGSGLHTVIQRERSGNLHEAAVCSNRRGRTCSLYTDLRFARSYSFQPLLPLPRRAETHHLEMGMLGLLE